MTPEGGPPKILVGPRAEHADVGLGSALGRALVQPIVMMGLVAKAASRAAQREQTELSGPVSIVSGAQEAQRQRGAGAALLFAGSVGAYFVWIVGLVSLVVALAVRERPQVSRR